MYVFIVYYCISFLLYMSMGIFYVYEHHILMPKPDNWGVFTQRTFTWI